MQVHVRFESICSHVPLSASFALKLTFEGRLCGIGLVWSVWLSIFWHAKKTKCASWRAIDSPLEVLVRIIFLVAIHGIYQTTLQQESKISFYLNETSCERWVHHALRIAYRSDHNCTSFCEDPPLLNWFFLLRKCFHWKKNLLTEMCLQVNFQSCSFDKSLLANITFEWQFFVVVV